MVSSLSILDLRIPLVLLCSHLSSRLFPHWDSAHLKITKYYLARETGTSASKPPGLPKKRLNKTMPRRSSTEQHIPEIVITTMPLTLEMPELRL